VDVNGNLKDKGTIKADFRIEAASVEKQQYKLEDVSARGSMVGFLLTVSAFSAHDARGAVSGHADYRLLAREGRFDIESSIDIPRLLKSWLNAPIGVDLLIGGSQRVQAAGDFDLSERSKPAVHLTGHALCDSVMFRGVSFDSLETWFSYQNGNLFLRDLTLTRPDGVAEAKLLVEGSSVRLALHSTIPAPLFKPFFPGQPLEKIIGDFTENENPSTEVFLEGSFDLKDRYAWNYSGHGNMRNLSYKGVPVKAANCSFKVNHGELDFYDGSVTFDYTDYPLRKAHGGPREGTAKIGRIRYDAPSKTVGVEAVSGDIWAAPMIRLFAPKIADGLEQYRFHSPPSLSGSGIVDVTPQGRTDLIVKFSTPGEADYKFLGQDLTLSEAKATVTIRGDRVGISDLSLAGFGGSVMGNLVHTGKSKLTGELSWSKVSMEELSSTYDFEMKGGGLVTGRIEFGLTGSDVKTMDGDGLIGLEQAELFSVPIFGPLSPVMATVLNDKRMGFERAKSAFLTFNIRDGILRTRDFQTATTSVTFAGDGEVDLSEKTIDFTIRLNARGLLGLLTLPLRPFYGLFQFRGTGPLGKPTWENVHFTSPPEGQNEILLAPPPKALVVPE
jgi:AsmA-like C-terminal region